MNIKYYLLTYLLNKVHSLYYVRLCEGSGLPAQCLTSVRIDGVWFTAIILAHRSHPDHQSQGQGRRWSQMLPATPSFRRPSPAENSSYHKIAMFMS